MGGLGFTDPVVTSSSEYEASIKVTNQLVRRMVEQQHQPPDTSEIQTLQLSTRKQKDDRLSERLEQVKNSMPTKAKRAVELATEKGSSNWLTVIPLKELDYNLNKKVFRDAIKLRYYWEIMNTRPCSAHAVFNLAWITQWCVSAEASLFSAIMNCAT